MKAPQSFADWLNGNVQVGKKFGRSYHYHSRSDSHSVALCEVIMEDLLLHCAKMREQAELGVVAYGVNVKHMWESSGKVKTLDLVVGIPASGTAELLGLAIPKTKKMARVLLCCEAKSVMTEHGKSQPRVFDELSSSHQMAHRGDDQVIAAGVTVVNIASSFVSPLRQTESGDTVVTPHNQPHVAARMVKHLRGLRIREGVGEEGFDAYCTIVVDCDNQVEHPVSLWTDSPAPQPGDADHYDTFLERLARSYTKRFSTLQA